MFLFRSFSVLLFFCLAISLSAQESPYELSWKKDVPLLAVGGLTLGASAMLEHEVNVFTESDLLKFNRSSIANIDVQATYFISGVSERSSDHFRGGSYVMPALLLIPKRSRKDIHKIGLLYAETYMLNKGITNLTKRLVKRARPFVYNESVDAADKTKRSARYSFFSGHTSTTASNCFFFAKVFSDYYPDSKLKPYVWTISALTPAAVGYFRVRAGKHFPTDVVTGYALGALVGFMVPQLHKKNKKIKGLDITAGGDGFLLTYTF